jgi:hypothetical protein
MRPEAAAMCLFTLPENSETIQTKISIPAFLFSETNKFDFSLRRNEAAKDFFESGSYVSDRDGCIRAPLS